MPVNEEVFSPQYRAKGMEVLKKVRLQFTSNQCPIQLHALRL